MKPDLRSFRCSSQKRAAQSALFIQSSQHVETFRCFACRGKYSLSIRTCMKSVWRQIKIGLNSCCQSVIDLWIIDVWAPSGGPAGFCSLCTNVLYFLSCDLQGTTWCAASICTTKLSPSGSRKWSPPAWWEPPASSQTNENHKEPQVKIKFVHQKSDYLHTKKVSIKCVAVKEHKNFLRGKKKIVFSFNLIE